MYAIIRTGGGHYYTSTVFARLRDTSKDSWREEYYLTLNEAKTALVRSYAFEQNTVYIRQLVLITQTDSTGWVADSDGLGCVDFLASYQRERIERDITAADLARCIDIDRGHTYHEWRTITGESDIADLMEVTGGFHDAYIEDCRTSDEGVYLHLGGIWGCTLEMWFKGGAEYSAEEWIPGEGSSSWFGAVVLERDGFYYLIDSEEFDTDEDIHHIDKSYSWFKGKSVSYHVIPR